MSRQAFSFNLGPISRTLGRPPEYIGFASLPIHEAVTALLSARNRDEFIDWLWHDTFKALFVFVRKNRGQPRWLHLRDKDMGRLAAKIGVSAARVLKHHSRNSRLLKEGQTITNEFDARYLGAKARFIQMTFRCQPAATTQVLRLVILEAFLRAVGEVIGQRIQNLGLRFTQVRYVFVGRDNPAWTEDDVARLYQMKIRRNATWTICHVVPSGNFGRVKLTIDLTGAPPNLQDPQTLALSELLTVYRDDLTVIVALPLFVKNPSGTRNEIWKRTRELVRDLVREIGIVTRHKGQLQNTDLLEIALDEQVEVRLVDRSENVPGNGKPVHTLIGRPYVLMSDPSLNSRCLVCGSPIREGKGRYFKASRNILTDVFSGRFTDLEHVDLGDDVCPMCLIYASSENKRLLRGAMAVLSPSTSLRAPISHRLIERPRFDRAGRFDPNRPMVKAGMTLQEMVLLTILSSRIIAGLMPFDVRMGTGLTGEILIRPTGQGQPGESVVGRCLPYSGAYLLFEPGAVRQFFEAVFFGKNVSRTASYDVWRTVRLVAYPFELDLSPSFSMLIELQENADFQTHAQAHTLLKARPSVVYLSPDSAFYVLVDNSVQERVDREFVETWRLLDRLASAAGLNRYEFIQALLSGEDPLTAAYEVASPRQRMGAVDKISKIGEVISGNTPEEMWNSFVRQREELRTKCQEHSTLIHFLLKPKRR